MRSCDFTGLACWTALAASVCSAMNSQTLDQRYLSSWALQPHQLPTARHLLTDRHVTSVPRGPYTAAEAATPLTSMSRRSLSVAVFAAINDTETWPIQNPTEEDPDWTFPRAFE